MDIHPTAIIESGAVIGPDCVIHARAIVTRHAVLGAGVVVHPCAVIGGDPQYLRFDPACASGVEIGAGSIVREHCTINRSIHAGQSTRIGARCFLMANAHVGHDCRVGDDVVLANNVMLAGHVSIGDHAFVGGGAGLHQFCRLGESVMIGGLARLSQDVPPFVMAAERNEIFGLNLVGLRRRAVPGDAVRELRDAFRIVYLQGGNVRDNARAALSGVACTSAATRRFLEFFGGGSRGFARPRRAAASRDRDPPL
jgi:UDP-N-acetylglucosamine acyltransferase